MSTSLNDLGAEALPKTDVDMDNLPAEGGGYQPLLPSGPYLFELSPLTAANFTPIEVEIAGVKSKRVQVNFDQNGPLVIRQSVGGVHDGEPHQTRLSNVERARGRKADANRPLVSDWDYLNSALKVGVKPGSNKAYAEQLIKDAAARKQFRADQELSWFCNDKKDAWFPDEQGNLTTVPDPNSPGNNIKGCGKRYYESAIDKVDGTYPERIECECKANVRAFGNLRNFRSA